MSRLDGRGGTGGPGRLSGLKPSGLKVMAGLEPARAVGKAEAAARLRERAGALFGGPEREEWLEGEDGPGRHGEGAAAGEQERAAPGGPQAVVLPGARRVARVPGTAGPPGVTRLAGPPDVPATAGPPGVSGTVGPVGPAGPPGVPGVRVFSGGRVGRLREWLFVRCGLEFSTVLALAVVLAVAAGLAVHHYWVGRPRTVALPPPAAAPLATPAVRPTAIPKLTIDIAGRVARPGLRRLPKGARVADALSAAGGPLPGTDTTPLNLARPLTDGEQILVGITPAPDAAAPGGPAAPADPAATAPLSLNSATAAQLDALPGVGPVLAQHILAFRSQHGGFTSPQQLRQIPGIGPRKYATLQPLVHP